MFIGNFETRCSSNEQASEVFKPEARYARWQIPGCILTHAQSIRRSAQELEKPDGNRGGEPLRMGRRRLKHCNIPKTNGIRQAGRNRQLQNGRSSKKRANHLAR